MKILIDMNHPAHVHYFRNFIKLMEAKGHQFCIINRDSKMINQLLDYYGIKHTIRNKRPEKKGTLASMLNLLKMTLWCIRKSFSFKPDMYIGFGSSACAITSWVFHKPSILLDDTEHNVMNHRVYKPFASTVLTPFYFNKDLQGLGINNRQIKFNAYVEQLYLNSAHYKKEFQVLDELNIKPKEYVIVRYIAYDAHHDLDAHPLSEEAKKRLVAELAKRYRVFISLENNLKDPFYDRYALHISPEKMHDLMASAKFLITEGATMASEAFVLGVPYLYLNPLRCGNIDYQCNHYSERCYQTTDAEKAVDIIYRMMDESVDSEAVRAKVEKISINPTEYLCWFVENYPESRTVMKETPDYQYNYR